MKKFLDVLKTFLYGLSGLIVIGTFVVLMMSIIVFLIKFIAIKFLFLFLTVAFLLGLIFLMGVEIRDIFRK